MIKTQHALGWSSWCALFLSANPPCAKLLSRTWSPTSFENNLMFCHCAVMAVTRHDVWQNAIVDKLLDYLALALCRASRQYAVGNAYWAWLLVVCNSAITTLTNTASVFSWAWHSAHPPQVITFQASEWIIGMDIIAKRKTSWSSICLIFSFRIIRQLSFFINGLNWWKSSSTLQLICGNPQKQIVKLQKKKENKIAQQWGGWAINCASRPDVVYRWWVDD